MFSDDSLDALIRRGRPEADLTPAQESAMEHLIDATYASLPPTRKHRPRIATLALSIAIGSVALTGGAIVFTPYFDPDVRIPVRYVTDAGRSISCTVAIRVGPAIDASATPLREWLSSNDWTGFGQLVYEDAIANPALVGPEDTGVPTQTILDSQSFFDALNRQVVAEIPSDLADPGGILETSSDCAGELH